MKIYQIKIELKRYEPKIWRRLLIQEDLLLSDFHKVIQSTMGWTNSHLHQFIKEKTFYTQKSADDLFWNEMKNIDYKGMKVSELLKNEKDRMIYEYDFGDSWKHEIILEKILPYEEKIDYPKCIKGKMNCPPEDCGGIFGYAELLEIINQPEHEEYEETKEWLGEEFDPEYFDTNKVNDRLKLKNYGCIEFF